MKSVQDAIASGRIAIEFDSDGRKLIDVEKADFEWDSSTDFARAPIAAQARKLDPASEVTHAELMAAGPAARAPYDPLVAEDDDEDDGLAEDEKLERNPMMLYFRARAKKEFYSAQLKKLEYERKAGELVKVVEVRREFMALAKNVKEALLNLPARIAADIAGESDHVKVAITLEKEIREALLELCGPEEEDDGSEAR